MLMP